ncbi:MAG: hypothetical protein FWH10_08830 [Oscillospiraceae bacterium]|nr:hypothetical protein [Oscillospiraceae bacterium]
MIYALDSDIVSYMIKGDKDTKEKFMNMKEKENFFSIPPLVYYEVKRWLDLRNATTQLQEFSELYHESIKNEMTLEIWEKAIEIYVKLILRGTPVSKEGNESDIFIAAFCIVNDYILVTNNIKHFKNIKELKVIDWRN